MLLMLMLILMLMRIRLEMHMLVLMLFQRLTHYLQFPISPEDEEMMKYETERCVTVLGFCHSSMVPRNHFMSSVDVVVPEPDHAVASLGLSALVHALIRTRRVAIVRYVKRKNAVPVLGVLTPCM